MLNERSQAQKGTCCVIPFLWISRSGETQLWWGKSDQWWPGVGAGGSSLECWKCFFYFDEGGSTSNAPLKMVAFYFKASLSHFTERELMQKKYGDSLGWLRGPRERQGELEGCPCLTWLDAYDRCRSCRRLGAPWEPILAQPRTHPSNGTRKCLLWHEEGWLCSLYIPA